MNWCENKIFNKIYLRIVILIVRHKMSYSAFLKGETVIEMILKSIINTYIVTKREINTEEFDINLMKQEKKAFDLLKNLQRPGML